MSRSAYDVAAIGQLSQLQSLSLNGKSNMHGQFMHTVQLSELQPLASLTRLDLSFAKFSLFGHAPEAAETLRNAMAAVAKLSRLAALHLRCLTPSLTDAGALMQPVGCLR